MSDNVQLNRVVNISSDEQSFIITNDFTHSLRKTRKNEQMKDTEK